MNAYDGSEDKSTMDWGCAIRLGVIFIFVFIFLNILYIFLVSPYWAFINNLINSWVNSHQSVAAIIVISIIVTLVIGMLDAG